MSELLLINPRKRRKAKAHGKKRVRSRRRHLAIRSNPIRKARRVRRFRRNPIGGGLVRNVGTQLKNGAIGAAGAIATEMALSYLPVPDSLKSGPLGALTSALTGVLIGVAVGKMGSRSIGEKIADGAITVALYKAGRSTLAGKLPGLAGYDDGMGDASLLGYSDGLGDASLLGDMGYVGPAPSAEYNSAELI